MPRFYFDLQQDRDERGSDLPDIMAAERLAKRYAGELLRDDHGPADSAYWRMDVRQGAGPVLFSLVLELVPGPSTRRTRQSSGRSRHTDEQYV